MTSVTRSRKSLDAALVTGVAWTSAASWITQLLTWASTLVVVRILTPDDYGLVALSAVYLGLASLLAEFGLGTAVVTIRDLSRRQIAQLNTVALLFATVAVALSLAASGPISVFFASPRLAPVIEVMSATLVLTAASSVSSALLQKELAFRFLAQAQIAQALIAAVTTLVLALLGIGYWALAIGPLMGQATLSVLVLLRRPVGYARPAWRGLGQVLRFSRHVIVERAAWYGYTGADKLVIGKLLGEIPLGLYSMASTFGLLAVEKVTVLMLRVAPAVFSEVQTDPRALRRYFLSMTEVIAVLTFPISVGFALVADDMVLLFFGARWEGAIVPLQLLGLYGAFQSVAALLSRVLAALGEVRFAKQVALGALGIMPLAFVIGSRWGLGGVASAWLVAFPLTQLPIYLRLHRQIELTAMGYLRSLWPALSGVVLMAAALFLVELWPAFAGLARPAHLVLRIALGALVYGGALLLLHHDRVREFRDFLAEIRAHQEAPREAPAT